MLFERILELKQNTSSITSNPTLDAIETDECKWLDSLYNKDEFIKAKIESCLSILKNVNIDYIPQYKSVYEEYNEAITYCNLLNKKLK